MFSCSLSQVVDVRSWTRWSLMVAASSALLGSPVLADDRKIMAPLSIVVMDYAGTPAPVMREALVTAGVIFRDAGVNVTWTTRCPADLLRAAGPDTAGTDTFGAAFVQVLNAEMVAKHDAPVGVLGRALPGSQIAWVLTPRVKSTARDQKQPFGTLLGHVIAHEIGDLLLPTGSHTRTGLMAAAMDLREMSRRGLRFDSEHSDLIRARLLAGFPAARVTSTR